MFVDVENLVEKINAHLPPEICIQSEFLFTHSFDFVVVKQGIKEQ